MVANIGFRHHKDSIPSAPSRNFVIDLRANRIKQKDKRHVGMDESKEVKGPDWQSAESALVQRDDNL